MIFHLEERSHFQNISHKIAITDMERLFVGIEIEINRSSTTTNKKSEKANHEFLHFSLFSLTLQSYTIKTAFPPFYCIISPHPRKLGTNRAVETSLQLM